MGRSFGSRLALANLAVVALTLLAVGALAWRSTREALYESGTQRLVTEARLAARALPADPAAHQAFARSLAVDIGARVTLIARDGRVLADSQADPARLENHGSRPEVVAAEREGAGVARRDSDSLGRPLLYVAVRLDEAGDDRAPRYIRLARPAELVEAPARRLLDVLAVGLLVGGGLGVLAAALGSRALRLRAAGLAAVADAVARNEPVGRPPARQAAEDEFAVLERHLEATAADLSTYVAALAEQRRRVEAIVGSLDDGLIVITAGGEILLMNAVAERLLDVAPDAWRGLSLLEITRHPDLHDVLARAAAEGRASGEVRFTAPRELDLAVSMAPLRGPETLGFVVALRDVTRLKKLERVRTDFVANVSHEIKTPLAAVRAALETLRDWALEDPAGARRYVAICLAHAERLQRLIDDLLALSDIELRQVRLTRRQVDLGGAVDETFDLLRARADERGVTLVEAVPAGFPPVVADRNRLIQILVNLVDNGVKYTPRGGRVSVSAERLPGGECAVVVSDTGIGVPRADLPRLGERFYRVNKGRSRDAGGTGLGLAIVKHLTQLHGGRLEIASDLGKGTTVRVIFPPAAEGAAQAGG